MVERICGRVKEFRYLTARRSLRICGKRMKGQQDSTVALKEAFESLREKHHL
jgi:hypothetical protein